MTEQSNPLSSQAVRESKSEDSPSHAGSPVNDLPCLEEVLSKRSNKLAPTVILCGQQARDDVVGAIAKSMLLGVEVLSIDMFIKSAARVLSPRVPLTRSIIDQHVEAILREDAVPTKFHEKNLHCEPATRSGITDAIVALFNLPPEQQKQTGNQLLPEIIFSLAQDIHQATTATHFSFAEAAEVALSDLESKEVLIAGDIATSSFEEWFIDSLPHAIHTRFGAPVSETNVEKLSFVEEHDEVEFIVQAILKELESGTPAHAIAVGYCEDSYLPLLISAAQRAGLPIRVPQHHLLAEDPFARALAGIIRLYPDSMHYATIAEILATGVVKTPGFSAWTFDKVTRGGSVQLFSGDDWDKPTDSYLSDFEFEKTEKIKDWVKKLRESLRLLWNSSSWEEAHGHLSTIRSKFLRSGVPSFGAETLLNLIAEQPGPVNHWQAITVTQEALGLPAPVTFTGQLSLGNLDSLVGRNLTTAFICGCTDKALPGSLSISPTLTEHQTGNTPELFLQRRRRIFNAAFAASAQVVATYPRSHWDGSGKTEPSLWISGIDKRYNSLLQHKAAGEIKVLDNTDISVLKALSGDSSARARAYLTMGTARSQGAAFDEPGAQFNGFVGPGVGEKFLKNQISTSALEAYTNSPLVFLLANIARARVLDFPEASLELDPRDRGTFYHEIFEKFIRRIWLDNPQRPENYRDTDFSAAASVLSAVVDEVLDENTSSQVSSAVWTTFKKEVHNRALDWLEDEKQDAACGWTPLAVEFAFGTDYRTGQQYTPLHVTLDNGKEMLFKGIIDRVDYCLNKDGTKNYRVTDYKSGSSNSTRHVTDKTPTGGEGKGFKFQLAVYGELVRSFSGANGEIPADVSAELKDMFASASSIFSRYWYFLDSEHPYTQIPMNEKTHKILVENLTHFYDYVTAGHFPPYEIAENWIMEQFYDRLSPTNYDAAARALAASRRTPLPLHTDSEAAK